MNPLEAVWQQPVARALAGALIGFVWQGAVVALVVWALLTLMDRRPAHERYALACLGLLVMALLPLGSFWAALRGPPSVVYAARSVANGALGGLAAGAKPWLEVLGPWLLAAWLGGVLVLSLRTVLAWRRALALTRAGTRQPDNGVTQALTRAMERTRVSRPVRLLVSVAIEVPTVVGLWRPFILVPASSLAGLGVSQLEAILAHELAHIRRHDYLVNLLQALVETALFYHPAVWWLSERIRQEREHCADDVAVESCGDVVLYSRALLSLEQLRTRVPVPAVAANGGSLLPRIQRLLAGAERGGAPLHPWRLAGGLAAATLILLFGAAKQAHGAVTEQPVSFGEGMTHPVLLSGEDPRLSGPPEPSAGPGPGTLRVVMTCTLTAEGRVTDCPNSDPSARLAAVNAEVVRALGTRRYEPVTFGGKPIAVRYTFIFKLSWPRSAPSLDHRP